MSLLPLELIEEIIDVVAECHPESLADCALVGHQWNPRSTQHLYRIFRRPTITTFDALHVFSNIVGRHRRLASIAISLEIAPDPELNLGSASYIPFHHLSSSVLPNVRQLVLGETLRWSDYPLLYCNSTVGFTFHAVTELDLSCHFNSVSDMVHLIRSFRNIQEVRLHYSHQHPPHWMLSPTRNPAPRHNALSKRTFRLQNLELPLTVLKPVLDVCGDFVVNLSILCPRISALSMNAVEGGTQLVSGCSLASLRTVKIVVPMESNGTADYAGLRKLGPLSIAPITKPEVLYSLLFCCPRHADEVLYQVAAGASTTELEEHFETFVHTKPDIEECSACAVENLRGVARSKEALLVGVNYNMNQNLPDHGFEPLGQSTRKDVTNMRRLLVDKYGYSDDDITTLVDSEDVPHEYWPTRDNILSAMKKLTRGKQACDHIVFSFSGHGGRVQSLANLDEEDSILLPVDCTFNVDTDHFANFLAAGEIRDILVDQLADGVRCTMIFDCSFAGTVAGLPVIELETTLGQPDSHLYETNQRIGAYPTPYSDKVVTSWSACLDEQLTFSARGGGIFTEALTSILCTPFEHACIAVRARRRLTLAYVTLTASTPHPTHKRLLEALRYVITSTIEIERGKILRRYPDLRGRILSKIENQNRKLARRKAHRDLSPDFANLLAPIPQLGSLHGDSILLDTFTL